MTYINFGYLNILFYFVLLLWCGVFFAFVLFMQFCLFYLVFCFGGVDLGASRRGVNSQRQRDSNNTNVQ